MYKSTKAVSYYFTYFYANKKSLFSSIAVYARDSD